MMRETVLAETAQLLLSFCAFVKEILCMLHSANRRQGKKRHFFPFILMLWVTNRMPLLPDNLQKMEKNTGANETNIFV